ncbi:MAG TPA: tRNA nucleotidyltransferase, partial [Cyclobacteriaceae bacterium]|nr:tRNA nucleotidyltransferase [Cyclobacteriaceae bacterium]
MDFKAHLDSDSIFGEVAAAAQQLNTPAFVVGGYVRDLILKRTNKDIDF